ncbi:MAG: hypothetical protein P4L48_24270 [Mycobacterium sp.]|jgi:hypothetical protein|nr:hypothetical protein [Mycobacterium sp.]HKI39503.1 hypothetical protein [Mycobacterium sp.]
MNTVKKMLASSAAMLVAGAGLVASTAPAQADPVWHQVVYIVSARNPAYVDIFYQDQDPTTFSDYSHNNYQFTPQVHADVAPGKPWVQPVNLLNPDQWAMVTATMGREPGTPGIQCDLSVDGKVVVSKVGSRGALCSLRPW